uniref:Uncharacterized protein n=1 Tax=Musa acuminata subsp. malaccensis TaxID=214687 RepID=A0A804L1A2_MUSAM
MLIDGDDIIVGDWLHCGSTLVLRQRKRQRHL